MIFQRVAASGADYKQGQGDYNQTGGGNHDQSGGNYTQAKTVNPNELSIITLAEMLKKPRG
jgi:hypothetical protein